MKKPNLKLVKGGQEKLVTAELADAMRAMKRDILNGGDNAATRQWTAITKDANGVEWIALVSVSIAKASS